MIAVKRRISGAAYRNGDGLETGSERFALVTQAGGPTLRALCERNTLDLIRDVSLSLDQRLRPLGGVVRILIAGRTAASTLFRAGETAVQFQGGLTYLGVHPIVNDALITQLRGEDEPGALRTVQGLTNSKSANRELGLYAMPTHIDAA